MYSDRQAKEASKAPPSISDTSRSNLTGLRQRAINSCLACRRRKVRCDHKYPICSACERGNHACSYLNAPLGASGGVAAQSGIFKTRVEKERYRSSQAEISARLDRLEALLLAKAVETTGISQKVSGATSSTEISTAGLRKAPSNELVAQEQSPSSVLIASAEDDISSDGRDGTLLLGDGQSHFFTSSHWALLADEIHDIKLLVQNESPKHSSPEQNVETVEATEHTLYSSTSLIFGHGRRDLDLSFLLPEFREDYFTLLDIFLDRIDIMIRIIHKPTFKRRFTSYIDQALGVAPQARTTPSDGQHSDSATSLASFESLAFATFFCAIGSMKPLEVVNRFGRGKTALLERYRQGLEQSLAREDLLTTCNIEVLQAFVYYLTFLSREDDMDKAWSLIGLATRIAISQGLHMEPSLFVSKKMDAVQVELRRRVWHQICQLDFRACESKGQKPLIMEPEFTTRIPRNIADEELHEGSYYTGSSEREGFTDITNQVIRHEAFQCFRSILRLTEGADKMAGKGLPTEISAADLDNLFSKGGALITSMLDRQKRLYLRHCNPDIPFHRLTLAFGTLVECRMWVTLWMRIPRNYRETAIPPSTRVKMFSRAVSIVESINIYLSEPLCEPYRWHADRHGGFSAFMLILAELRNPTFTSVLSDPAHIGLRAQAAGILKKATELRSDVCSNTWTVLKRLIEKIDDNTVSPSVLGGSTNLDGSSSFDQAAEVGRGYSRPPSAQSPTTSQAPVSLGQPTSSGARQSTSGLPEQFIEQYALGAGYAPFQNFVDIDWGEELIYGFGGDTRIL